MGKNYYHYHECLSFFIPAEVVEVEGLFWKGSWASIIFRVDRKECKECKGWGKERRKGKSVWFWKVLCVYLEVFSMRQFEVFCSVLTDLFLCLFLPLSFTHPTVNQYLCLSPFCSSSFVFVFWLIFLLSSVDFFFFVRFVFFLILFSFSLVLSCLVLFFVCSSCSCSHSCFFVLFLFFLFVFFLLLLLFLLFSCSQSCYFSCSCSSCSCFCSGSGSNYFCSLSCSCSSF